MRVVEVATFSDFEREFSLHQNDPQLLALFLASIDPSTNESWCPDCRAVFPLLNRLLSTSESAVTFLWCYVGSREEWKNQPENPFRLHEIVKVKCVPTLIRFEEGRERERLEEGQILSEDRCRDLFST